MGTRLSDRRPAGTRPLAATPPSLPGWPQAGRATTLPARKGLAHCRIDGLAGALPAPETPLFSGLLGSLGPHPAQRVPSAGPAWEADR